jgi:hypothetical protein
VDFPGVVLQHAGQERLGEEETAQPEGLWDAVIQPIFEEAYTLFQVGDVARQRFQGWVGFLHPEVGHTAVVQGFGGAL